MNSTDVRMALTNDAAKASVRSPPAKPGKGRSRFNRPIWLAPGTKWAISKRSFTRLGRDCIGGGMFGHARGSSSWRLQVKKHIMCWGSSWSPFPCFPSQWLTPFVAHHHRASPMDSVEHTLSIFIQIIPKNGCSFDWFHFNADSSKDCRTTVANVRQVDHKSSYPVANIPLCFRNLISFFFR